jgi:diguanylate cyclase (GGDEF)-like protein
MVVPDHAPLGRIHCISSAKLAHFLKREPRSSSAGEFDLNTIFRELLKRANDFLPSEAGTIYLDDPLEAHEAFESETLVVIAGFGPKADDMIEERFSSRSGIVGEVYRTGAPYSTADPFADPVFRSGPGLRIGFTVDSVVCAPLAAEGRVIGVIELLNHRGGRGYSERDVALLGIFAQTISLSIVNAIDAHRSKEIAKRDELTDLYNDRYLHSSLARLVDESVANGTECGVIFLDLDHFKQVNDVHGHLVGSEILKRVGATLKQIIPGDGLATRYGGDEFVIALPGAGRQETLWVAETIRQNIADATFVIDPDPEHREPQKELRIAGVITCSIGIATLQADVLADNPETDGAKDRLLRAADRCMYVAKDRGRNCTVPSWELEARRASAGE